MGTLNLIVSVGGDKYAIPCHRVVEVVPSVRLHRLPRAPEWICGAFAYRGSVTAVVDLRRLLTDTPCPIRMSSRIVIISPREGERHLGLLAERVNEIKRLDLSEAEGVRVATATAVSGVVLDGQDLIRLLDLGSLVPSGLLLEVTSGESGPR